MQVREINKEDSIKLFDSYIRFLESKEDKFLIRADRENLLFLPEKTLAEILESIRVKGPKNFNILDVISSEDIKEKLKEFIEEKQSISEEIQIGLAFPAFPKDKNFYIAACIYKLEFEEDLSSIELLPIGLNEKLTNYDNFKNLQSPKEISNNGNAIYSWTKDVLDIIINLGSNFAPPPISFAISLYSCKNSIERLLSYFSSHKSKPNPEIESETSISEQSIGFLFGYTDSDYTKNVKSDLEYYKNHMNNNTINKLKKLWDVNKEASDINKGTHYFSDTENFVILNHELTDSQKRQYRRILSQDLCLIEGPPGTGKSELIATFCADSMVRGETVIVTSTNNKAIDSVLKKLEDFDKSIQSQLKTGKILKGYQRLGNQRYLDKFKNELFTFIEELKAYDIEEAKNNIKELQDEIKTLKAIIDLTIKITDLSNRINNLEKDYSSYNLRDGYPVFLDEKLQDMFDKNSFETFCYLFNKLNKWYNYLPLFNNYVKRKFLEFINHYKLAFPLLADINFLSSREIYKRGLPYKEKLGYLIDLKEQKQRLKKELETLQTELNDYIAKFPFLTDNYMDEVRRLYFIRKREYMFWELASNRDFIEEINKNKAKIEKNQLWGIDAIFKFSPVILTTALSSRNICRPEIDNIDTVIVDEASQTLFCYTLPLYLRGKKFVAIGDKNQLQPVLTSELNDAGEKNIPSHLHVTKSVFDVIELLDRAKPEERRLLEHFRCQKPIIEFCDKLIGYGLLIKTQKEKYNFGQEILPDLMPYFEKELTFIHVKGKTEGIHSKYNEAEIKFIFDLIKKLLSIRANPEDIAIISPYRAQVDKIKAELKELFYSSGGKLLIGTVHSLQGDEREIVILSCVCSNTEQFKNSPLFKENRLMNVAVSRAKKNLVVIGNRKAISDLPPELPLKKLYDHILNKGKVIDASQEVSY